MLCKSIISLQSDSSMFSISKENGENGNRCINILCLILFVTDLKSQLSLTASDRSPRTLGVRQSAYKLPVLVIIFYTQITRVTNFDSPHTFGMQISHTLLKKQHFREEYKMRNRDNVDQPFKYLQSQKISCIHRIFYCCCYSICG